MTKDASVRTCTSCSLTLLLQEHTVPGIYPQDYLNQLIFGTKIESILPGRCLTVTSAANSTKIFIGGAEITHPNLFISDHVIIHGLQGFISHLSPYSCSMDRMTSLSLRHLSPSVALTRMMLVDAGIRLRLSGYSFLALAMRVKYAELVTLQNMTIFAVDDSSIFQGGHSYVHGVRFHIIPNQMLKFADLESLPPSTVLPTLESGETLTITTPGGGGTSSPMRINYVKIKYPDLIYNYKLVVHGIGSPFPHLRQSIPVSTGRSGFYPITAGEYGSDVTESSFGIEADDARCTESALVDFDAEIITEQADDHEFDSSSAVGQHVYSEADTSELLDAEVKDADEAYNLYNNYAYRFGFSIRKGKTRPRNDGTTGCKAHVPFAVDKSGVHRCKRHVMDHNHKLVDVDKRHWLRSQRNVSKDQLDMFTSWKDNGMGVSDAYRFVRKESGGFQSFGCVVKDVYNAVGKEKIKKIEGCDTKQLLKMFAERQAKETDFYYDLELDEKGHIISFFWRDGIMKHFQIC
uniref:Protein FAR1-RELATED SEQUENCE n=1 Tax=Chenopodium quinoa TaxID=63459 RepID=A0A803LMI2_CHEQI